MLDCFHVLYRSHPHWPQWSASACGSVPCWGLAGLSKLMWTRQWNHTPNEDCVLSHKQSSWFFYSPLRWCQQDYTGWSVLHFVERHSQVWCLNVSHASPILMAPACSCWTEKRKKLRTFSCWCCHTNLQPMLRAGLWPVASYMLLMLHTLPHTVLWAFRIEANFNQIWSYRHTTEPYSLIPVEITFIFFLSRSQL